MSFQDLKKQSKMGSLTEKLIKQVEKLNETGSKDDNRFWKPAMDKGGTGSAVIRFLPAPSGCELPWAQVWSHAFQGPGGWLIDNCLTTNKGQCPVCEANRELWNTGSKDNQNIVRDRKRKLSYYANIYVVKDPVAPENEGKVLLYKFGKKVFDKIMAAMKPEFDDEKPINAFDFWEGANFKLKLRKVEGYWNYDKSEFAAASALSADDTALEAIWRKAYSLQEFVAPSNFKTYEELEERLNMVLGITKTPAAARAATVVKTMNEEEDEEFSAPAPRTAPARVAVAAGVVEEEDDALSYFARLAEED